jgi:hypothetical protein
VKRDQKEHGEFQALDHWVIKAWLGTLENVGNLAGISREEEENLVTQEMTVQKVKID